MSLILDALKKLEKDRVARRKRPVRVASDILLAGAPAGKRRTPVLMAGLAGIAVAVLVLAVVIVNPFPERIPVQERETVPAVPAGQAAKSVPASESAPAPEKNRVSAGSYSEDGRKTADPAGKSKQRRAAASRPAPAAAPDVSRLPVLTVTGIVWVEDRGVRRAMVNGEIVSEGGRVGGARVMEIHPDHVRFSHDGRPFSIYLK